MKKFLFGLAVLFAFVTTPVSAQTITQDLATARAKYGALISREQAAAVLNEAAWKHRTEGWGLLAKPGGNRCPQPTTRVDVSCDWLVNRTTGKGADVLSASTNDDGSPAPGRAGNVNATESFDVSRFVAPVQPTDVPSNGGGQTPPPPPPPPPAGNSATADLQQQQLVVLLQIVQQLQAQNAALVSGLADLKAQVASGLKIKF